MATNQSMKNQMANKQNNAKDAPQDPSKTIAAYMKKMGPKIESALPNHINADRMGRIALTTIQQNPALLECTIPSLLGATLQAAQLGLEPGLIGHCYFVPFNNKKKGPNGKDVWQKEVTFIIGYKGMIDLARRSGHIESIYAQAVYSNDEFEYEFGLDPKLVHKPSLSDRGDFFAVYGVAKYKDGGFHIEVLGKDEIEKIRKRSKGGEKGPWVTDYEEMAKKTVVRRMFKYLPISIEVQQGAAQDETIRKDVTEEARSINEDIFDMPTGDPPGEPEPEPEAEQPQEPEKDFSDDEIDDLFKSDKK
ncbi:recombination protein RecT [Aureibacillus halotolerans]|uniref:Recombination protein RecT n=1 Tax=Aureibacillus halotolerans TaxID=1508390 RepID=A0A4R6TVG5_9BACI|nr:recombination protein RecT [Aureibacillus halotolerans]TDQ35246.1 recombination protein RecT [Aureibacillus halotolerans]